MKRATRKKWKKERGLKANGNFYINIKSVNVFVSLILTGYYLAKKKHIPENSAMVLSRLENMLFIPGLVMGTFIENFTVERISSAWKILLVSFIMI